jgi:hypothetical protein
VNAPDHDEISRLFLEASELREPERAEFLDRVCGTDPELRKELESLLVEDAEASAVWPTPTPESSPPAFFSTSEPDKGEAASVDRVVGRKIDEFLVRRRIATGGMGRVYEAQQQTPKRLVALKLLKEGFESPEAKHRFFREIEILGRMKHPGIAQVYQSGTYAEGGASAPYFAMEYITGSRNLVDYCREENLDLHTRLRLFLKVCEAVYHGHLFGFLHRDLKPDNILVTTDGHPKVIDYGVARATDADLALSTFQTEESRWIGTLPYMSPEQCEGDATAVDVRSDVYSLGVVLYEMLCQQLPYDLDGVPLLKAARIVSEQEPFQPHNINPDLQGDLEWVMLQALAKPRDRRYQSVELFGKDIESCLAGRPVEAHAQGWWLRPLRWASRHPIASALLGAGTILLTSALFSAITVLWLFLAPHRVVGDSQTVEVVSRLGFPLEEWTSPSKAGIISHSMFERAPEYGAGKVVLIGYRGKKEPKGSPGDLCLYEADDGEVAIWSLSSQPLLLPPNIPERDNAHFSFELAYLWNIFPDVPGEEIVTVHRSVPYSQTAVRIFDQAGRLHYQVWHDGGLRILTWLEQEGLLIAAGHNSETLWDERGNSWSRPMDPPVLFAVRPQRGHVERDRFIVENGRRLDETLTWYKWLGPEADLVPLESVSIHLSQPSGSWDSQRHFMASIYCWARRMQGPDRPGFNLILDVQGTEVSRVIRDRYTAQVRAGLLPPPTTYRLLDYENLEPLVPPDSPDALSDPAK